jgi:hypothetical protein
MSVPLRTLCLHHALRENKNATKRGSSDGPEGQVIEAGRTNFSLVRKNNLALSISTLVNHGLRE